ncbi:hypothetical protein KC19_VG301000 [Ceratodon purpureus]|uniref:Uncharacterized protein n=1 Tax=Ceratodon purpureus TaxID=3225 RepID=A0A8T0HW08_CERPU|nr:hypothetical protein KC19_VG301000 [Ceratodon purpureus]
MASFAALVSSPKLPDLSRLSPQEACKVLKASSSVFNVHDLSEEWQDTIATAEAGIVPRVVVQGKFGEETVIVCQSTSTVNEPNQDVFSESEHD